MSKDLSSKYYRDNKGRLKKNEEKRLTVMSIAYIMFKIAVFLYRKLFFC